MRSIPGFIILMLMSACSNNPSATKVTNTKSDTSFTIKGTAGGITKGIAILTYIIGKNVHTDTSIINKGGFSFTGRLQDPQQVGISFITENYNGGITFFAENAFITAKADTAALDKPIIDGSLSQKQYEDFKKQAAPVHAKFDTLNKAGYDIFESGKLTKAIGDSLYAIKQLLETEQAAVISSFVKANPASVVSAWAISKNLLFEPETELLEPLFNSLTADNKYGIYGSIIHETIVAAKASAIGKPAADFILPDTIGKPVSLASFKGKYTFVDFWASWCGPCRAENPTIVKIYNQYKTKGFDVLGVSLDTDKDAWIKAIRKDKLSWTAVSDLQGVKGTTAIAYGIKGIPFNLLLDKNGTIIAKNLRGEKLEDKLKEIFK